MTSGNFRRFKRYKNVIFRGIYFKIGIKSYQDAPLNIYYGFLKTWKIFEIWHINKNFGYKTYRARKFRNFENSRSQFCSTMYLLPFWYETFDSILKTVASRAFLVKPYFGSKIVEYDVTLTSFPADPL